MQSDYRPKTNLRCLVSSYVYIILILHHTNVNSNRITPNPWIPKLYNTWTLPRAVATVRSQTKNKPEVPCLIIYVRLSHRILKPYTAVDGVRLKKMNSTCYVKHTCPNPITHQSYTVAASSRCISSANKTRTWDALSHHMYASHICILKLYTSQTHELAYPIIFTLDTAGVDRVRFHAKNKLYVPVRN